MINWERFEKERKLLEKKPKNLKNLIDYMRASASIGQVYDYLEAWQKELDVKLKTDSSNWETANVAYMTYKLNSNGSHHASELMAYSNGRLQLLRQILGVKGRALQVPSAKEVADKKAKEFTDS